MAMRVRRTGVRACAMFACRNGYLCPKGATLKGGRDRKVEVACNFHHRGARVPAPCENSSMPPRPHRQEGTQARCTGGLAGEQAQRDGSQSQRNRPWTEDEEVQLAVLLLQHGTSWTRVAAGLDGRSANAARCKVRNDIRAAWTAYRHKRREYGRLLFRLAYRMEEQGLRLEQLRPTDLVAELSPSTIPGFMQHTVKHRHFHKRIWSPTALRVFRFADLSTKTRTRLRGA